ncbi:HAMP domain-containing histidine kinase [Ancylothrix sp. C2]|uniref:sensor histidine kinase n=1 Tax=Ancylothrix sp. D3o TaxID=2953691 RepID=UPI0021BB0F49|nr:HAMP domain-containing histidine kinase [Ancylothrix sp. D3o]MCT7952817.1 HAMP domain-containing histidine kinase [Ancylothrix sp. D3o]
MNNLLTDLEHRNAALEQKVKDLTEQINQKDRILEENQTEFNRLKDHLVQMEKMAMLGQMVSGISHEINNPINFIYGNLPYVEEHIEAVLKVLETYQSVYPSKNPALENVLEETEIDFVLEDLPRLVESMKVGAERIRELVLNLRNFYRLDEAQMKEADLNAGIESTLVMLHNRYKQKIEVIKQFGDLPPVECHINQLNQVFMNLLGNAIDALLVKELQCCEENNKTSVSDKKKIAITTQKIAEDKVSITISDNGLGISAEVKNRVFEPFFTTKPIGVGTGLGLSISHQIVTQTHGGKIYCFSTPGEGSTFVVELPIHQSQKLAPEKLTETSNHLSMAKKN